MMDSPMQLSQESEPESKCAYELRRDQNVARMAVALEPVLRAAKAFEEEIWKKKPPKSTVSGEKVLAVARRSERQRGLRGRQQRKRCSPNRGGKNPLPSNMDSGSGSFSETTESNEKAMATAMDSSDEELSLEEAEPLVDIRTKRKKPSTTVTSPVKAMPTLPPTSPTGPYGPPGTLVPYAVGGVQGSYGPPPPRPHPSSVAPSSYGQQFWPWVPGQYIPGQATAASTWPAMPPAPYLGAWTGLGGVAATQDSAERFMRRKRKKAYDKESNERATAGVKPNRVRVLSTGEVDPTCEGKNAWDLALRDLVPAIIDMSVTSWSGHQQHTLQKLRQKLDAEFEYLDHPLSMVGFRSAVTKFLKTERSRLKAHFVNKGPLHPPVHVNSDQWERLIAYWETPGQKLKSSTMAAARAGIKSSVQGGRKAKVLEEEGEGLGRSSRTGGVVENIQRSPGAGTSGTGKGSSDSSRWAALESWKKEVDFSLSEIHATSSTHSAALEELRSMFHSFMMSSKGRDEGSPSISKSALENEVLVIHQESKPAATIMDASKKQILVSLPAPGGGATSPRKSKRVPNATTAAKASKTTKNREAVDVTPILLDEEPMVTDRRQPIVKDKAEPTVKEKNEPIVSKNVDVHGTRAPDPHMKSSEPIDPNPAITIKPVFKAAETFVTVDSKFHRPMEEDKEKQDGSISLAEQEDGEEEAHEEEAEDEEDNPYNIDTTNDSEDAEAENDDSPAETSGAVEAATGKPSKKVVDGTTAVVAPNLRNRKGPLQSPSKVKQQKREPKPKPAPATPKKVSAQSTKKYKLGDKVFLSNPATTRFRVAIGQISGIPGIHKFHFNDIPETWFKVDILEIMQPDVPLMMPRDDEGFSVMKDVKGTSTLWNQKYLKLTM